MKKLLPGALYVLCICLFQPLRLPAQMANDAVAVSMIAGEKGLFDTEELLEITLSGNVKDVLNDRKEVSQNHPLQLLYKKADGSEMTIPVEVKTRGHFRKMKTNCIYPPLLITFSKTEALQSSLFEGLDKLKLVMPCTGDEYVVKEWLVYKLYNLVTPMSFKTRLVKVTLLDAVTKKPIPPFYGLLLEGEKQMAKRNGLINVERKIRPEETDRDAFLNMTVFQYLIGNTDWGVQYLQNIKLIAMDSTAVPFTVAYDFDHAGIVNTPYAQPAEELELSSIRERRYRGYCIEDMTIFNETIALFNKLKAGIYNVYTSCTLLDDKYVKSTVKFLDDFYKTINDKGSVKRQFGYPCDKTGTGNVVIKGLKQDGP